MQVGRAKTVDRGKSSPLSTQSTFSNAFEIVDIEELVVPSRPEERQPWDPLDFQLQSNGVGR